MKNWNFGYFGKGIDGYAHYMTAFKRSQKQNNTTLHDKNTHSNKPQPNSNNEQKNGMSDTSFCLLWILGFALLSFALIAVSNIIETL